MEQELLKQTERIKNIISKYNEYRNILTSIFEKLNQDTQSLTEYRIENICQNNNEVTFNFIGYSVAAKFSIIPKGDLFDTIGELAFTEYENEEQTLLFKLYFDTYCISPDIDNKTEGMIELDSKYLPTRFWFNVTRNILSIKKFKFASI